jgi:hypothetical protein
MVFELAAGSSTILGTYTFGGLLRDFDRVFFDIAVGHQLDAISLVYTSVEYLGESTSFFSPRSVKSNIALYSNYGGPYLNEPPQQCPSGCTLISNGVPVSTPLALSFDSVMPLGPGRYSYGTSATGAYHQVGYSINFDVSETAAAAEIPVATTLALLPCGILGLVGVTRRRARQVFRLR